MEFWNDHLIFFKSPFWFKVNSLGQNYLMKVSCKDEKIFLQCLSLSTKMMFESFLNFEDAMLLRRKTGNDKLEWQEFFSIFIKSFTDDVFISYHVENKSIDITIWCNYNEKQISFEFSLMEEKKL